MTGGVVSTIYFGTNRDPNRERSPTDFGDRFSRDGLANLRFGQAEVDPDSGEVSDLTMYPERRDGRVLGSRTLFDTLQKRMFDNQGDLLIFIHGFNTTFKDALHTAAILRERYRVGEEPLNVVAFSWPSDGSANSYRNDRHDAKSSGLAFARGIEKVLGYLAHLDADCACKRDMHLIAHSMGNYVLRHAVQEMLGHNPGSLPRLFEQVILAAADEDDDALEKDYKLKRLPELCRRVSVYFNRGDRALNVSDWTKGNPDRLGSDGPSRPTEIPMKVSLVDCGDVVGGLVEHSYFHAHDGVVQDIVETLQGVPDDDRPATRREFDTRRNRWRLK
jgi:esterase/lipase superfamily enzyme